MKGARLSSMFRSSALAVTLLLILSATAFAQSGSDACHVYLLDVKKAQQAFEALADADASPEAEARARQAGQQILGEFSTVVGEEELTTKTYPFPGSKLIVTASLFYTDESMASKSGADSVQLGLVVSLRAEKNALNAKDNAVAEVPLNRNPDVVRVKKFMEVGGRLYLIGIECNLGGRSQSK